MILSGNTARKITLKSINSEKPAEQFADVRRHVPFLAKHESLARCLESLLCYPKLRRVFAEAAGEQNLMAEVIRRLGLKTRFIGLEEKVPQKGPVVVVCNHSHGGADATALMGEMARIRPDFKALANRETALLPGLGELIFPVSILQADQAAENVTSIRAMLKHVKQGGALGLFPAGRVAVWRGDRMRDPVWNEQVVKLLQRMDATVIPLWFYGSPPAAVNLLSRLSGFVRTALIPTAIVKMRGQEIVGRAGDVISGRELREMGSDAGPWLRRCIESLDDLGN